MSLPDLVAPSPQPRSEPLAASVDGAPPMGASQRWLVRISDAKYHWYDLLAGFPEKPDIRDPVGRYLRRMQFDLEAANEKSLIYCVVNRPRVRFDASRETHWGFFSLKLTVPLLTGANEQRDSVTVELKAPFGATVKKPTLTLTENFLILNWGGVIEVLSVHDLLQTYVPDRKAYSQIMYVGQTRDPEARLSRGRLPVVQKLHQANSEHSDTLLLVLQAEVEVVCDDGDPAELAENQSIDGAAALARDRVDVIEAALIRYFEGPTPAGRYSEERCLRNTRLREVQQGSHLTGLEITLQLEDAGNYRYLGSDHVAAAGSHAIRCQIVEGEAIVSRPPPAAPV